MIDKAQFATGMGLLAGAFSRTLDDAVASAYYVVLNPKLTTEEFQRAVELTLAEETFWPSPAKLLGKVKQGDEAEALAAFEHVNRVTSQAGGYRFLPFATYEREFDERTKAAILAVGGLPTIANTNEDRWAALQRRFVAAYSTHGQPQLAATGTDDRVKALVGQTARQLSLVSGRGRAAGRDE